MMKKGMSAKIISIFFIIIPILAFSFPIPAAADISAVEKSFMEGRYEKASQEAGKLIDQRARQRYELYYLKGLSDLKLNRFKESRDSFDAIIKKYPGSS
ncbi:MAG: hypothetical protein PHI59_09805, partial [Candidatus Omnitrophica bacterium]|nr:hypothetical protein [Candidatus Omnitrophota bacterium]